MRQFADHGGEIIRLEIVWIETIGLENLKQRHFRSEDYFVDLVENIGDIVALKSNLYFSESKSLTSIFIKYSEKSFDFFFSKWGISKWHECFFELSESDVARMIFIWKLIKPVESFILSV